MSPPPDSQQKVRRILRRGWAGAAGWGEWGEGRLPAPLTDVSPRELHGRVPVDVGEQP